MIEYTEGIHNYYVYILTNKSKNVLYTGVTNNLPRRLKEHEEKLNPNSFAAKYNLRYLIYFEKFGWIQQAIAREKQIKALHRDVKFKLIQDFNSNLDFLNKQFGGSL
jgi:putative endonuclease